MIWTTPDSRGSPLIGYEFMIIDHDGNFQSAGTNLDLNVQVQDTFFELQMNLLADDPYNLVQGDLIAVKARAINSIGNGDFSDPNAVGVTMQQPPSTPLLHPILIS